MKKCPFCAEEIQDEAIVCRFCGKDLRAGVEPPSKPQLWSPGIAGLLSFLIPGAGSMYKGEVGFGIFWFFLTVVGYFVFVVPGLALHLIGIALAAKGDPTKPGNAPPPPGPPPEPYVEGPMDPLMKWIVGLVLGGVVILLVYALLKHGGVIH